MRYPIAVNVPRCPECKGFASFSEQKTSIILICNECRTRYEVVDMGNNTNELVVERREV